MIANFGDKPITFHRGQQVATADSHSSTITKLSITHAEIFGIEDSERHTYKKCGLSASDNVLIKKYLTNSCKHMHEEENLLL